LLNGWPDRTRGRQSTRTLGLLEREAEIDRLLFKAMAIGELPQIEETLRQARRWLYSSLDRS
jgi:hypothetical protein